MILVKCAGDARQLAKSIDEFNLAPNDVLKDISESVQANMLEGIYILKDGESIEAMKTFLTNRGFSVVEVNHDDAPALQISW